MNSVNGRQTVLNANRRSCGTEIVTVRGMTIRCWNCRRWTTVVVGLHLAPATSADALIRCDREPILAAAADILRAAGRRDVAAPIAVRPSRVAGGPVLSNGCSRCAVMQADHVIYGTLLDQVLADSGLDGLDHLTDAHLPRTGWETLRAVQHNTDRARLSGTT